MNKAIVYLLNNNHKDILNFRQSFPLLYNHYYKQFPCDIICFYEQDFPQTELSFLKSQLHNNINILFEPIRFSVPEYKQETLCDIPQYFPHPDFPASIGFSMGYRHMCRFFAGDIFKNKIISKYKYIWRLDTDSFILEPIRYDVFNKLQENNALYGYINIQDDHPGVIKYLWEYSQTYFESINKNKIFHKESIQNHKNRVYYTNFEVCDVEWFSSHDYQNYFKFIDDSAGIYKYRWGDHSIRYIALNSLLEPNQMYFYHDIRYFHQKEYYNTHTNKSCNAD